MPRRDALQQLAGMLPRLADIRSRAIVACAANPALWLAVHGVALVDYLAKVDELIGLCRQAQSELAGEYS